MKLAIGAIVKNEAPYILEWVAFHRVVGIDAFFIADNDSTDGTTELLARLDAAGLVTHIPFPSVPGQQRQLEAYAEIMRRHGEEADWIAFVDADEFLLPTEGERSIRPLLQRFDRQSDIGAVVANWAIFGSSGLVEQDGRPVIERFSRRAETAFHTNHHYKAMLRPRAYAGTFSPHKFVLATGYKEVHTSGAEVLPHPIYGPGRSAALIWDGVRVNHYVVKSADEFFRVKQPRGRANLPVGTLRPDSYFTRHDHNEVFDPVSPWLLEATKSEIVAIGETVRVGRRPSFWRRLGRMVLRR